MTSKEYITNYVRYLGNYDKGEKNIKKDYKQMQKVLKDLERKEQLEKENQKLKERYKRRAETSKELNEALTQHLKVIEILKDYLEIRIVDVDYHKTPFIYASNVLKKITNNEILILLKEVLE